MDCGCQRLTHHLRWRETSPGSIRMQNHSPNSSPALLGLHPPRVTHIIQPSVKWFWRYWGSLENGCCAEAGSACFWLQAEGRWGIDTSPKHQGLYSFGDEKGLVKAWWFINNSFNWREPHANQLTSIWWVLSVGDLKSFGRADNVVKETDHRHIKIIDNAEQSLQQRDASSWCKVENYKIQSQETWCHFISLSLGLPIFLEKQSSGAERTLALESDQPD